MIQTKTIVIIFVLVALLVGGLWWYDQTYLGGRFMSRIKESRALYENEEYGIVLNYRQEPNGYVIVPQQEIGGALLTLSLFRYADYQAMNTGAFGQEGPPSIALQVFNNTKNDLPWDWVKKNARSNYSLSPDKKLTPGNIADRPAVSYTWSGLYEGESAAILHNKRIYLFSVMSDPTDSMRQDFKDLLVRLKLK